MSDAPISRTDTEAIEDSGDDAGVAGENEVSTLDLAAIERDLDGVELALSRLDAGTYWTDEVTGATLSDELLAANPVARRA